MTTKLPVSEYEVVSFHQALERSCPKCGNDLYWCRAQAGDRDAAHVAECCHMKFEMVPQTVQLTVKNLQGEDAL